MLHRYGTPEPSAWHVPRLALLVGDEGRELDLTVCGAQPVVDPLAVRRDSYCWAGMGIEPQVRQMFSITGP